MPHLQQIAFGRIFVLLAISIRIPGRGVQPAEICKFSSANNRAINWK